MNKAVFLDRDGVINKDAGYVYKTEDFRFMGGVFDFCRIAQDKGYLLIVVTNQSGIARGFYSEKNFQSLTDWMLNEFEKENVRIAKVYYCPYHPENGIGKYRRESPERKPNPGMLLKAKDDFNLDLAMSIVIGDKTSDIEAGINAGLGRLIFLQGKYEKPNHCNTEVITHISEALQFL